jgi:hypothetical protein
MKTPGRILIRLAAFALVMGITYMVMNANKNKPEVRIRISGFDSRICLQAFPGRVMMTFSPFPSSLSAEICPPWAWTMDLAIASPSPDPLAKAPSR